MWSTLTSLPDEQVAVRVTRNYIACVGEGDGCDVLGPLPVLKDAHSFGKHSTLIIPEGDVVLPACDNGIAVHWGEVHGKDLICCTLQKENDALKDMESHKNRN